MRLLKVFNVFFVMEWVRGGNWYGFSMVRGYFIIVSLSCLSCVSGGGVLVYKVIVGCKLLIFCTA